MIALVVALALIGASVDPAEASPQPAVSATVASPAPSPAQSSVPILAGITLDEGASGVLLREGVHSRGVASGGFEFAFWPAEVQDIIIGIIYDQKVRLIFVRGSSDPHGHCADPYGIRVGDTIGQLVKMRGQPDDASNVDTRGDESIRYGPENGVHWSFLIVDDEVIEISVADGTH
jgi:hypothetical protein